MADMNKFDNKMKGKGALRQFDSSDEEEQQPAPKKPMNALEVLQEKNRILMDKLFKLEA